MDIRSEGKVNGVIHDNIRYIRFSFYDEELNGEFSDWWIREPLDVLTKVRDRDITNLLDQEYTKAIQQNND